MRYYTLTSPIFAIFHSIINFFLLMTVFLFHCQSGSSFYSNSFFFFTRFLFLPRHRHIMPIYCSLYQCSRSQNLICWQLVIQFKSISNVHSKYVKHKLHLKCWWIKSWNLVKILKLAKLQNMMKSILCGGETPNYWRLCSSSWV